MVAELGGLFAALRRQAAHTSADLGGVVALREADVRPLAGGRNNSLFSARLGDRRVCVKLHRQDDRRRDQREWDALTLLAGVDGRLAPAPISFDTGPPPVMVMSVLPGRSLGEQSLSAGQVTALADAQRSLHAITPHDPAVALLGSTPLPARLTDQDMSSQVARFFAAPDERTSLRRHLVRSWRTWTAGPDSEVLAEGAPPVFGQGDPNLTNCLWEEPAEGGPAGEPPTKAASGGRLSLIDFEYAGWSTQSYELALLIEHVQSRHTPDRVWRGLLDASRLTAWAERRTLAARRLVAWFWVTTFWPITAADDGRFHAQAARLTHVLAESTS